MGIHCEGKLNIMKNSSGQLYKQTKKGHTHQGTREQLCAEVEKSKCLALPVFLCLFRLSGALFTVNIS